MGTRSLLVFRIKGKVVMQVYLFWDGYPDGVPSKVAKLLIKLVGEVQVHSLIITIIATLKDVAGSTYLSPITQRYGTTFPAQPYCYLYVFDFNDNELAITVTDDSVEIYNIPAFARLCCVEVQFPYALPTFKFDTSFEGKEFVQMVNSNGDPLFFMAAKDWYKNVSPFVLGIELRSGLGGRTDIGDVANGSDCLAAQIMKKTKEFCGDDALILSDIKHTAMPIHTVAIYNDDSTIAVHDEDDEENQRGMPGSPHHVQGIHSHTQYGIVVKGPSSSPVFTAWAVGNMRNRKNWQLTSVKQFRNVIRLITALATENAPRPSVKKRRCEKEEGDSDEPATAATPAPAPARRGRRRRPINVSDSDEPATPAPAPARRRRRRRPNNDSDSDEPATAAAPAPAPEIYTPPS